MKETDSTEPWRGGPIVVPRDAGYEPTERIMKTSAVRTLGGISVNFRAVMVP